MAISVVHNKGMVNVNMENVVDGGVKFLAVHNDATGKRSAFNVVPTLSGKTFWILNEPKVGGGFGDVTYRWTNLHLI